MLEKRKRQKPYGLVNAGLECRVSRFADPFLPSKRHWREKGLYIGHGQPPASTGIFRTDTNGELLIL